MRTETFGEFVRKERLERGLSLRSFAKSCGMQPSNYCHVENGALNPTPEQVDKIAAILKFEEGGSEYRKLMDLAALARKGVPSDLQKMIDSNKLIPALLRTVEDEEVGPKQLRQIIEDIKSGRYKASRARLHSKQATMRIHIDQAELKIFCCRNHIRKLSLFGSVLREDFRQDSDVDVLVEFQEGHVPGLSFFALQDELSLLFGRKVELYTPAFLSHYFRDEVIAQAQVQYAA